MIGDVIGSYRIERELGEGGMSSVYVGRTIAATPQLPHDYKVVLKVMSPELASEATARKRFIKEAEILERLRHRYITRFFEFIPRESGAVLVMEYVIGKPLDALIAEKGALDLDEAIRITQCLLEALVYAHGKGIVHRDIKPANLITTSEVVKVTDFGIAKIRESGTSAQQGQTVLTRSGFILGTPHFMSPEQIREPRDAGARSDVYSSAVVLYQMITGALPFNARSLPRLIDQIYRGDKPAPSSLRPEVDEELEAIVVRAMHPDLTQRYATAREFFEALEEYQLRPRAMPAQYDSSTAINLRLQGKAEARNTFELVSKGEAGRKFEINGQSIMVGRDRSCAIVLSHPAVSRRHARLSISSAGLTLEDLKSANGTFVNDARVMSASVKPGDVIRFGGDPSCAFIIGERDG
jgi:eukaryotic-like serine/threonine-protein kinase